MAKANGKEKVKKRAVWFGAEDYGNLLALGETTTSTKETPGRKITTERKEKPAEIVNRLVSAASE